MTEATALDTLDDLSDFEGDIGTAGDPGAGEGEDTGPTADELQAQIAALTAERDSYKGMAEKLVPGQQQTAPEQKPAFKEDPLPENLEYLDRGQLLALIESRNSARLQAQVITPLVEEINRLQNTIQQGSAKSQLAEARAEIGAQFDDWREEMAAKIESTPGLGVIDAYHIVRGSNPDKAAKMDKKHAPAEPKTPAPEAASPTPAPAADVSIRPGATLPVKTEKMGFEEAANAAWKKHGPGLVQALRETG